MPRLKFFVPSNPIPKERPKFNRQTGKARTPERTKAYEDLVTTHANLAIAGQDYEIPDKDVPLMAILHFYRADNRRADADNLQKAVMDALNGIAYADDSQIGAMVVTVARGMGSSQAGVVIEIRPYMEELSIVENLDY